MKYSVITFGCRVNQADSLGFEEAFCRAGASATSPEDADLVVVNTCSVTASSDQGARQAIRRVARMNPDARIVVTGCYATRRPDEVRDLPGVVHVVPNDDKPRLLQVVTTTAERFGEGDGSCGAAIEPGIAGRTAYTLRVQTGCAEPCAYCIIPTTRGAPRSVPVDVVLRDVERVVAAGFKEIALTGVHLGSYGCDLTPRTCLLDLLSALTRVREAERQGSPASERESSAAAAREDAVRPALGLRRSDERWDPARIRKDVLFRISSLEPMDCTGEIVDLVASSDRFAPHFHLPLQHGSNRVLAAMGRPYTIERYSALVGDIRARMPHAAIGTDVIVGFPGETDDDFGELAAYLERSPLTHIHVFPYSDRPGTAASTMKSKVPGVVIRARARRVREISEALAGEFRLRQVGTVHRGLTLDDGSLVVTGNYLKVRIPPGPSRNEWIRVRIVSDHHGEPLGG